jgi:hypothetical protein
MFQILEGWMSFLTIRVQPDGVADNFGRKTMALVAGYWFVHAAQSVKPELN